MTGPWEDFKPATDDGPWKDFAPPAQPKPGILSDVVATLPGIVPRAAAGLIGLPQTLLGLVGKAAEKIGIADPGAMTQTLPNFGDVSLSGYNRLSEAITGQPLHQPQTGPGRIVDVTGQVIVGGPGSTTQKAAMGAAAGATGEAGRLSGVNSPLALGVLQMLGAGAASLPFILRNVPAANISEAIRHIKPTDLAAAQSLMDDAARVGAPITGAEAIAHVTGKNTLQDIQRVVEASRSGGPILQGMMNERPQASRAAFEAQANTITPMPTEPARTPVRMQQAAENAITRARQAGNAAAAPDYAIAETQAVSPSAWNSLIQQPAAQKALSTVKQATEFGVTNEREGSIRWLNAAKTWLDSKVQSPNTTPAERRIWQQGLEEILTTADAASAAYKSARATVAQNRKNVVNPMQESPVGDIAATKGLPAEQAMRAQGEIMMPQAPRALDPAAIRRTVSTLRLQDPNAARDFARQNLQALFDEAAQNLSGGANQWGAAKFAAQVAGNPRQRENLQALVDSVSGPQTWAGFNRLLQVLEAQGKRHAPGSQTAFNQQIQSNLSVGGAGTVPAMVASPNKAMSIIGQAYDNFRFGKNTEEMARILTDPKSVELMRRLALEAPSSNRAAAIAAQIFALQAPANADGPNMPNR